MTRHMEMESICMLMELFILVNGKKINSKAKVKKYGQMVASIVAIIIKEKKRVMVCFYGAMVVNIKANSRIMLLMVLVNISGVMVENLKEIG